MRQKMRNGFAPFFQFTALLFSAMAEVGTASSLASSSGESKETDPELAWMKKDVKCEF